MVSNSKPENRGAAESIGQLKAELSKNVDTSVTLFKQGDLGLALRYFGTCLRSLGTARAEAEKANDNALIKRLEAYESRILKTIVGAIKARNIHAERKLGADEESFIL